MCWGFVAQARVCNQLHATPALLYPNSATNFFSEPHLVTQAPGTSTATFHTSKTEIDIDDIHLTFIP